MLEPAPRRARLLHCSLLPWLFAVQLPANASRFPLRLTKATKLRAGIRLVQRQKELKSAYLIRFGESAELLSETLRADDSISKLQKELGLKAALLEMERIFLSASREPNFLLCSVS